MALAAGSVLVAASGYIINDYFDLNIDLVNRPGKLVVEKVIKRRWVIAWHFFLSAAGIILGFYVDFKTDVSFLGLANLICVVFLFFYSISLKKKFLIGNVLISAMTAWVIIVLTWCENTHFFIPGGANHIFPGKDKLLRLTFLYAGFAFVISLIREAVKDMEDMEGDRKYGCKTMPIVWGLNGSKIFVAVWLVVLIGILLVVQFYMLYFGWWVSALYAVLLIVLPLLWVFKKLFPAQTAKDFHKLSTIIKMIMMTGILSMIFFRFSS